MSDAYLTIINPARIETKVKGSSFIGESKSAASVDEAQDALETIRKREHGATHHCYAYHIGLEPNVEFKYSDDGEPNGTAGKPIYDCIFGKKLTNVLIVVTRYFGGTKLGTGGLARAYSDAAKLTLEKSKIKTVYLTDTITLGLDFKFYDQVQRLLNKYAALQESSKFTERIKLTVSVRKSQKDALISDLTNLTGGQIEIEK